MSGRFIGSEVPKSAVGSCRHLCHLCVHQSLGKFTRLGLVAVDCAAKKKKKNAGKETKYSDTDRSLLWKGSEVV